MFIFRYIAVCKPLKSRSIITLKRTRAVIIAVCVFGLLLNITRFFEYHTVTSKLSLEVPRPFHADSEVNFNHIIFILIYIEL